MSDGLKSLSEKQCIPCQGDTLPLDQDMAKNLLVKLDHEWQINELGHLFKKYTFKNFILAMHVASTIAEIAEITGHHPDLHIGWGYCAVEIWTHKIQGLTESDFYLAAKIEQCLRA